MKITKHMSMYALGCLLAAAMAIPALAQSTPTTAPAATTATAPAGGRMMHRQIFHRMRKECKASLGITTPNKKLTQAQKEQIRSCMKQKFTAKREAFQNCAKQLNITLPARHSGQHLTRAQMRQIGQCMRQNTTH